MPSDERRERPRYAGRGDVRKQKHGERYYGEEETPWTVPSQKEKSKKHSMFDPWSSEPVAVPDPSSGGEHERGFDTYSAYDKPLTSWRPPFAGPSFEPVPKRQFEYDYSRYGKTEERETRETHPGQTETKWTPTSPQTDKPDKEDQQK